MLASDYIARYKSKVNFAAESDFYRYLFGLLPTILIITLRSAIAMLSLLVLTRFDESGAAPRYRIYQYLAYLQNLGIHIEVAPLFDSHYLNKLYFKQQRYNSNRLN